MRTVILVTIAASLVIAAIFWAAGGDRVILAWATEGQRAAQGGMGRALSALRMGDAAAVVPLLAVCFAYGFFHAAGPGHGKLLIGSYGAAREVGVVRLSAVAVASSLAQGATAILLVATGVWVLNWSRTHMTDLAERWLQPAGFTAIALVGLWLVYRGVRGLIGLSSGWTAGAGHHHHAHAGHGHSHEHGHTHDHGGHCGHAHAPAAEDLAAVTTTRELLLLIAAVAVRPCTGAIFLLILTAQMGVFGWGIAGTIVMALGTASVTVGVALAAVMLRKGALTALVDGAENLGRVQPILELLVGLSVAWIAGGLAVATL